MPSVVSTRTSTRRAAAYKTRQSPSAKRTNRASSPREPLSELYGSDSDSDATLSEGHPYSLDDPWLYEFESGNTVWVRTAGGKWHSGRVVGHAKLGQTREGKGLYYNVIFSSKIRKNFAPMNGEIKPDTPHIRRLLKENGWL